MFGIGRFFSLLALVSSSIKWGCQAIHTVLMFKPPEEGQGHSRWTDLRSCRLDYLLDPSRLKLGH